jgi:PST family polysaccharide transporter
MMIAIEEEFDFDPPHGDMKYHAANGFIYSTLAQGLKIVTQFLSVIIMARLLVPTDFGIIAMVYPIYNFALIFQNLGMNQAIIQRHNLTSAQLNSFFWVNVSIGLLICLILIGISPGVAWFYKNQATMPLTIGMALLVAIGGLGNIHGAIMVRKLQFRLQNIFNIASTLLSFLVSVLIGYLWRSYWSLYFGMCVGSLVSLIGSWMMVKWRPSRPGLVPETFEMMRFGLGVTTANLADLIANGLVSAVIGHSLGDRIIGLYDRATRLISAPLQQIQAPLNQVTGPILYRLHDNEENYIRIYRRMAGLLLLIIIPFITWAVGMPQLLIGVVMGKKWLDLTPIFVGMSLAILPQLTNGIIGWIFVSQGRSSDNGRWGLFNASVTVAALFIGLPNGIVGIAWAFAISQFLRLPLIIWFACRTGPVAYRHILEVILPRAFAGLISFGVLTLLPQDRLPAPVTLILGISLSYSTAISVLALFPSGRKALIGDAGFVKFTVERRFGNQLREAGLGPLK